MRPFLLDKERSIGYSPVKIPFNQVKVIVLSTL